MSLMQFEIGSFISIILLMTLYGILGGVSAVLSKKGIIKIGGLRVERSWKIFFQTFMKLISTPIWLLGAFLGIFGFFVYLIALQNFELSVVKPLVNTNLAFTFLFAYIFFKEQLKRSEWAGIIGIMMGMIFLGIITRGSTGVIELVPLIGLLPITIVGIIILGVFIITERIHNQEFFYSISAGIFYGLGAIFSKAILILLSPITNISLLFFTVVMFSLTYLVAIVSQQFAFNNGRLSIVSPITNSISILIPVVGAAIIFNEHFYLEKIVGLILILLGIILLRRTIIIENHSHRKDDLIFDSF
ncbi:MAG: EamA family transporter [Candidatus Heimdallarchaeota archaeon]|nr:MAG: EamA family transporter [Candidatus Heimdallarchaeota archaeon]